METSVIKTKVRFEKAAASQQSEIRHHRSPVSIGGLQRGSWTVLFCIRMTMRSIKRSMNKTKVRCEKSSSESAFLYFSPHRSHALHRGGCITGFERLHSGFELRFHWTLTWCIASVNQDLRYPGLSSYTGGFHIESWVMFSNLYMTCWLRKHSGPAQQPQAHLRTK